MFSMGNGAGGFRDRIGTGGRLVRVEAAVTLGFFVVGVEGGFFSEYDLELERQIFHEG